MRRRSNTNMDKTKKPSLFIGKSETRPISTNCRRRSTRMVRAPRKPGSLRMHAAIALGQAAMDAVAATAERLGHYILQNLKLETSA